MPMHSLLTELLCITARWGIITARGDPVDVTPETTAAFIKPFEDWNGRMAREDPARMVRDRKAEELWQAAKDKFTVMDFDDPKQSENLKEQIATLPLARRTYAPPA